MENQQAYFNVWRHRKRLNKVVFSYADYFIVSLFLEHGKLSYADHWIEIEPGTVVFANPALPSAWEPATNESSEKGYSMMFNNAFIRQGEWGFLLNTPLLDLTQQQAIYLSPEVVETVKKLFEQLMEVTETGGGMKDELTHSFMHLIIYEAMRGKQDHPYKTQQNAAQRTVELFLLLLDRQFPVDYPQEKLEVRSANDYAQRLYVHVRKVFDDLWKVSGC